MLTQTYSDRPHALSDLVHHTLARSPYFAGRNVRFELRDDSEVVLRGVVTTYYQKQIAQESVRAIQGVRQVRNELEVVSA